MHSHQGRNLELPGYRGHVTGHAPDPGNQRVYFTHDGNQPWERICGHQHGFIGYAAQVVGRSDMVNAAAAGAVTHGGATGHYRFHLREVGQNGILTYRHHL